MKINPMCEQQRKIQEEHEFGGKPDDIYACTDAQYCDNQERAQRTTDFFERSSWLWTILQESCD